MADSSSAAPEPCAQAAPSPDRHRERLRAALASVFQEMTAGVLVPLADAAGRVLAEELRAAVALPLFTNSQMDGYAVRSADVTAVPARLRVLGVTAAGEAIGPRVEPGTAVKVMTGAPVPEGADCVVPVEDTVRPVEATQADPGAVTILRPRASGEFLRHPGEDVRVGDLVLPAGIVLTSRHLAAAASLGVAELSVRRRPRVAVIATGSELVPPGSTLGPGQIWESNSLALGSAAAEAGAQVVSTAVVGDDEERFLAALDAAAEIADVVVTAGAVSMGDFEVVRRTLEPVEGAWFGHIAMQPGGPQGLASWRATPVVCLPGNPVSVLVSFAVLLRPLLRESAGLPPVEPVRGRLGSAIRSPAGRTQFLRGRLAPDGQVIPVSGPGSHLVASMAAADCLVEIPAEVTELEVGAEVSALPL